MKRCTVRVGPVIGGRILVSVPAEMVPMSWLRSPDQLVDIVRRDDADDSLKVLTSSFAVERSVHVAADWDMRTKE